MRLGKAAWLTALTISFLPPSPTLAQSPQERAEYPFEAKRLAGVRAEISALLLYGVAGGELPMAALAWPELGSLAGDGDPEVRLLVELEGMALVEAREGLDARSIEIHAYAVANDGSVAGHLGEVIRVDLESWGEKLVDRGLRWSDRLALPVGDYSLRILAMDRESGRYGLRILPLSLPSLRDLRSSRDPMLWGPFVEEAEEPWLRVRGVTEQADLSPLPAAMPVAQSGGILEMILWGADLPTPADLRADLRLFGAPGAAEEVSVSLVDRRPMAVEGVERIVVRATLPALATGSYQLTVSAQREGRDPAVALELFLLDGVSVPGALVWCRLRAAIPVAGDGGEEPRAKVVLEESGRRRRGALRREARRGYEAALRLLSSGSRRAAVDRLVGIEAELAVDEDAVKTLHEAELRFARTLAERQQEVLLPLGLLHLETYGEHRRRRQFLAATHSRGMIIDLATFWLELDDSEAPRRLASDLLVCLALELMEADLRQTGREVFRQALVWHPAHETAGLQLALSYERSALYDEAVSTLRRLVETNPKRAEARLRLAVNLARTRQPAKARKIYRRLLAEHNPSWVLTIAYEEMARIESAAERMDEAIALLLSGIDRLPEQQSLYLSLAHLLDRRGRPSEALELLRTMPWGAVSSPRHRYSKPPRPEIYRSLLPSASARLGHLARALEAPVGREERR